MPEATKSTPSKLALMAGVFQPPVTCPSALMRPCNAALSTLDTTLADASNSFNAGASSFHCNRSFTAPMRPDQLTLLPPSRACPLLSMRSGLAALVSASSRRASNLPTSVCPAQRLSTNCACTDSVCTLRIALAGSVAVAFSAPLSSALCVDMIVDHTKGSKRDHCASLSICHVLLSAFPFNCALPVALSCVSPTVNFSCFRSILSLSNCASSSPTNPLRNATGIERTSPSAVPFKRAFNAIGCFEISIPLPSARTSPLSSSAGNVVCNSCKRSPRASNLIAHGPSFHSPLPVIVPAAARPCRRALNALIVHCFG